MKLLRVNVISAKTCGGLLDDFNGLFRDSTADFALFDPLCFIGPNGTGKSQLMQLLAEIFQSAYHAVVPIHEPDEANPDTLFEIEYLIRPTQNQSPDRVMISRRIPEGRQKAVFKIQRFDNDSWLDCDLRHPDTALLLPTRIVGYTSGDNETLSLPFLISRAAYSKQVAGLALHDTTRQQRVADTRLMLIDYGTNLEVLVANMLFGTDEQRTSLLEDARVQRLHSCRCIVQLNHSAVTREVRLTQELEEYVDRLKRCSTCYDFEADTKTHIFDFWIDDGTRTAFQHFWTSAFELYSAFHKLSMLNGLAIKSTTRKRILAESRERHFAARLPEPADEDKVFRFEQVTFSSRHDGSVVDYVSLSDGEHQLIQLLGTMMMQDSSGVLFLLDEPESHFNPAWRVKCVSMLMNLPTNNGPRREKGAMSAEQDCVFTTHAPFMPSDMWANRVFIFGKEDRCVVTRHPNIETYGTTFDNIIEECFGVVPPISDWSRDQIESLTNRLGEIHSLGELQEEERTDMTKQIDALGHTVQKALLVDRLQELENQSQQ